MCKKRFLQNDFYRESYDMYYAMPKIFSVGLYLI